MDLVTTVFSTGWATGVNAYATIALLGLLGKAGVGEVPDALTNDGVIAAASVLYGIEFVADKVPLVDNAWDAVHTVIRPVIASLLGAGFAVDADVGALDEALSAGGSGVTALASHGVKAGLRLGINASPEPFSNIVASLTEDGLVAGVTALALENPEIAAVIALILLVLGTLLLVYLIKSVRSGLRNLQERFGPPP
jgi:Domain of unknown function (DUF4126)